MTPNGVGFSSSFLVVVHRADSDGVLLCILLHLPKHGHGSQSFKRLWLLCISVQP